MDYEGVRRFWDNNAKGRTAISGGNFLDEPAAEFRHRCELKTFHRLVDVRGKSMLEMGCGSARWGMSLAPELSRYHGVDLSEAQLKIARSALPTSARLTCSDVRRFDTDERFDIVYLSGVTQYLDEKDLIAFLRSAKRWLSPGGVLITRDSVLQRAPTRIHAQQGYECVYRHRRDFVALVRSVLGDGERPLRLTREVDGYGTPAGYPLEALKMILGRFYPRVIGTLYYPLAERLSWLIQTHGRFLYAWDLRHKFFLFES